MPGGVKKRSYVSPARLARAEATRARILEAAGRLFLEQGYGSTSTAAIGRAAGVSEASVFAVFGSKAQLLLAVVRDRVVRDADFPLREQPVWQELAGQVTASRAIDTLARVVRRAHDRSWQLLAVAAAAAHDDPAVADAVTRGAAGRHADCAWFVTQVVGVTEDAERRTDVVWTLVSVENYRHLVVERSWPVEQYEAWLSAMVSAALDVPRR